MRPAPWLQHTDIPDAKALGKNQSWSSPRATWEVSGEAELWALPRASHLLQDEGLKLLRGMDGKGLWELPSAILGSLLRTLSTKVLFSFGTGQETVDKTP